RVIGFLTANTAPQKTNEIAHALFGTEATPSHMNQVRAAAEALVQRGTAERQRQGNSVFYLAASNSAPTDGAAAAEKEPAQAYL
ncbi:hypothetical protein ABH932_003486, partial [Streptacidiphilus sp. MAP5-52]